MADTYRCVLCKKTKTGRFTRRRDAASGGWDQGMQLPAWYCWVCLPAGQGRDEGDETVAQKKATVIDVVPEVKGKAELVKTQQEVLTTGAEIKLEALEVRSIKTEVDYIKADAVLGKIRLARKTWGVVWDRILEKSIKPIREGLDELYALNRGVDGPLDLMETTIKQEMKAFKVRELEAINAAKRKQEQEAARLQREAEEKERQAAAARTPQMRGKLTAAAEKLTTQAEAVKETPLRMAVQTASSSTRSKKAWRVDDMAKFIAAVADGTLPEDALMVCKTSMDQYFKNDPEGMEVWPGVTVYDDVQIVGR